MGNILYVSVATIASGIVTLGTLSVKKASKQRVLKILKAAENRQKGYEVINTSMISEISSKSEELGEWLADLYLSRNKHGLFKEEGDEEGWKRLDYGWTDIRFYISGGRCSKIKVQGSEYPINKDTWNNLKKNHLTFSIIN